MNLATDPWIPVIDTDGLSADTSLLGAFSPRWRSLAGETHMENLAIMRVLLAILHRAIGGPHTVDEWLRLRGSTPPTGQIATYLREHEHAFKATVFMQDSTITDTHGNPFYPEHLARILPQPEDGLFSRPVPDSLPVAEAIRNLLTVNIFDVSGIKTGLADDPDVRGGKAFPRGMGWCARNATVTVEGDTLWETLTLMAVPLDGDDSVPAWELDTLTAPTGRLDLYTWPERRVRLDHRDGRVYGALVSYGPVMEWGDLDPMVSPQPNDGWRPHLPTLATWLTGVLGGREDVHQSRLITALRAAPPEKVTTLRFVSAWYGTKGSTWEEVACDALRVAPAVYREETSAEIAASAVADGSAIRYLALDLLQAQGVIDFMREKAAEVSNTALQNVIDRELRRFYAVYDDVPGYHRRLRRIMRRLGDEIFEDIARENPLAQRGEKTARRALPVFWSRINTIHPLEPIKKGGPYSPERE